MKNQGKHEDVISIIGPGVEINGVVNSQGSMRIDGYIKGDITAKGDVVIGDTGETVGAIRGKSVTLAGRVTGEVFCEDKLTLEANSTLQGDLVAKTLVIEAGAKFDGKSSMSDASKILQERD
ncbi:MAG: polymer-forming cytoskeletal protein [Ignavibacteriales bacterium]|nr:polymer-forming cytoskeletal protein [Ignavibacteriales bacterium]